MVGRHGGVPGPQSRSWYCNKPAPGYGGGDDLFWTKHIQPRSQGFFPHLGAGKVREKALERGSEAYQ